MCNLTLCHLCHLPFETSAWKEIHLMPEHTRGYNVVLLSNFLMLWTSTCFTSIAMEWCFSTFGLHYMPNIPESYPYILAVWTPYMGRDVMLKFLFHNLLFIITMLLFHVSNRLLQMNTVLCYEFLKCLQSNISFECCQNCYSSYNSTTRQPITCGLAPAAEHSFSSTVMADTELFWVSRNVGLLNFLRIIYRFFIEIWCCIFPAHALPRHIISLSYCYVLDF